MDKQKTILLVEDDRIIINIYKLKFGKLGFKVLIAYDGQEALDILTKEKPDVILLDLLLPKKDGFQVLTEIKANPATKDIPVVVASNLGQSEDIKRALKAGAEGYFVKSNVKIDDVVDTVQKAMSS